MHGTITITIACPREGCECDIDVLCDVDGGHWEGADADGNRAWYIEPYIVPDAVTCCPEGGHDLDADEQRIASLAADDAAGRWEYDPGEPDAED